MDNYKRMAKKFKTLSSEKCANFDTWYINNKYYLKQSILFLSLDVKQVLVLSNMKIN